MTDRERDLEEILARLEKQRPEIDRILSRPTVMDTKRPAKKLCRIPPDMDFTVKDGNTEYEVAGMFNPDSDEFLINTIIRKLGYQLSVSFRARYSVRTVEQNCTFRLPIPIRKVRNALYAPTTAAIREPARGIISGQLP